MNERENWSSNLGFILAASGSAIGLGNIWRFPYITGTNGGAAFLIIYFITIVLIGYPLIISEMSIGRKSKKNPIGAFKKLAPETPWWLVGGMGVFTGFVILSYYSVVSGWAIAYIFKALNGFAEGTNFSAVFSAHISKILTPIVWHAVFMLLTVLIISAGVVKGIQKIVNILMPILLLMILLLIVRSITLPGSLQGLIFYLKPDFSKITIKTFIDAIAQSFFTLGLGMGAMITYGSYLSDKDNISDSGAYVLVFDTLIALMAGFAIFPAVFALGLEPTAGPGLTFITLPSVFSVIPFGRLFGTLFFILLTVASLTSSISILEVIVSYLVDEKKWQRKKAAQITGIIIFFIGIPTVLGYSSWQGFNLLGMNILDLYDWLSNSFLLPAGGILTSIFVGYIWGTDKAIAEANRARNHIFIGRWFSFLMKYLIPIAMTIIMIINIWETFH